MAQERVISVEYRCLTINKKYTAVCQLSSLLVKAHLLID